jgi:hypothetical protein
MKKYIGTQIVSSSPMTKLEYNNYRGWDMPHYEDGEEDGYLVENRGFGVSNHPNHQGYIHWLPKSVFLGLFKPSEGVSFGLALEAIKKGKRVARSIFLNRNNMHIEMINNGVIVDNFELRRIKTEIQKDNNKIIVANSWHPSQEDILAEDWIILD